VIEHLLTPEGRERLSGGWAKLPKPVRSALAVGGAVAGVGLALSVSIWLVTLTCMALDAAGHPGLAIAAGITGTCLVSGLLVGVIVYLIERGDS
jgi:hypothetical protein